MSTDPKSKANEETPSASPRKGMKIFTYPKIIFIWPTLLAALICAIGMLVIRDETGDPTKALGKPGAAAPTSKGKTITLTETHVDEAGNKVQTTTVIKRRFSSPQNVFAMFFITVFFLNILVMSIDFPRFTIIAVVLLAVAATFFLLWLNVYFNLIEPLVGVLEGIFAVANAGFYLLIAIAITINFGLIFATRYLDYWEVVGNELLHNHGPFSDLERFSTLNLKFDKEIPDILEYMLLRSGRLVLHVYNERRAIVLDNVLWIDSKEARLKGLMSRLDVRVTTDQDSAGEPL